MNRFLTLLVALPLVLLAACGSSDDGPADADVTFVQQMLPHHEQAIEMADLVDDAGASAEVTALAAEIKAAQGREITMMKRWLDDWDVSTAHEGHDMGDMGDMGDGMMSDDDMAELGSLSGAAFDRAWLTMMIAHHEGAVAMARAELDEGRDARTLKLARAVVSTQNTEIATMRGLLG